MNLEMEKSVERTGEKVEALESEKTGVQTEDLKTQEKKPAESKSKKGASAKKTSTKKGTAAEDENDVEKPGKKKIDKGRSLVLVGAGSFTGRGVNGIRKGQSFDVDDETAEVLLETGLFREE